LYFHIADCKDFQQLPNWSIWIFWSHNSE
jgi:hypothetical protein